jgi:hypothetical protein
MRRHMFGAQIVVAIHRDGPPKFLACFCWLPFFMRNAGRHVPFREPLTFGSCRAGAARDFPQTATARLCAMLAVFPTLLRGIEWGRLVRSLVGPSASFIDRAHSATMINCTLDQAPRCLCLNLFALDRTRRLHTRN